MSSGAPPFNFSTELLSQNLTGSPMLWMRDDAGPLSGGPNGAQPEVLGAKISSEISFFLLVAYNLASFAVSEGVVCDKNIWML